MRGDVEKQGGGGGVRLAKSKEEIVAFSEQILGKKLVTPQTGVEGMVVEKLILSEPVQIAQEFYVGIVLDRERGQAVLIVTAEGGVDIEEVAAKRPDQILSIRIPFSGTLRNYHHLQIAKWLGWKDGVTKQGKEILEKCIALFWSKDLTLLEINPLVLDQQGTFSIVDAKGSVDDNALFRHSNLAALEDLSMLSREEKEARAHDLSYIGMDGDIGCLVNGAGLAMATMDIIDYYGGRPANFLDVGGGASQEKVSEGFRILLSDRRLKAIFVNIFGGILNCVTLAAGILTAVADRALSVPLVVRMEGTNVEEGKKILADSGLPIITVDHLDEAAEKVVQWAREG